MNQVILLKAEWGHLRVGIVGPIRLFGRPTMAMGMPLRHYIGTLAASFGSMALGSACVHAYMQPEMGSSSVAADFEKEAQARRQAIEEVAKLAMDERFGPATASGGQPPR
ncbi:unnamed protein product [Durusdinium trenchii]|uniref:Uncharacterized protein n=1 Tax=Durusdinium trenchii TaxID=1381693 RepID=A0ABP0IKB2_9DINO